MLSSAPLHVFNQLIHDNIVLYVWVSWMSCEPDCDWLCVVLAGTCPSAHMCNTAFVQRCGPNIPCRVFLSLSPISLLTASPGTK
jgi:hypothetical protein